MTTPLTQMAYPVQYIPVSGKKGLEIPAEYQSAGGTAKSALRHILKPGSYRLSASWDGAEQITFKLRKGTVYVIIIDIPKISGGGSRLGKIYEATIPPGTTGEIIAELDSNPAQDTLDRNCAATLWVITM